LAPLLLINIDQVDKIFIGTGSKFSPYLIGKSIYLSLFTIRLIFL
jgi:hypothetical protein